MYLLFSQRKGDQLSYVGQHAVIRRLKRSGLGNSWVLHVQWLSREVKPCKGAQLELISEFGCWQGCIVWSAAMASQCRPVMLHATTGLQWGEGLPAPDDTP